MGVILLLDVVIQAFLSKRVFLALAQWLRRRRRLFCEKGWLQRWVWKIHVEGLFLLLLFSLLLISIAIQRLFYKLILWLRTLVTLVKIHQFFWFLKVCVQICSRVNVVVGVLFLVRDSLAFYFFVVWGRTSFSWVFAQNTLLELEVVHICYKLLK